jgi:hypothetical protein
MQKCICGKFCSVFKAAVPILQCSKVKQAGRLYEQCHNTSILHRNIPSSLSLAAIVKPVCNTGCDIAHGQIRVTEAFTPSPCVTIRTLSPFASSAIACIQLQHLQTITLILSNCLPTVCPLCLSSILTLIYYLSSIS